MLKAWVREHFESLWRGFEADFGVFWSYAVIRSRCDRFAVEHFKHITYGRLDDLKELNKRLASQDLHLEWA